MHCPAYLHVWMQLEEPSRFTAAAAPLLSIRPVNQKNKGKSISLVATLSTVLVEAYNTCNKLAMLPLQMLIREILLNWFKV